MQHCVPLMQAFAVNIAGNGKYRNEVGNRVPIVGMFMLRAVSHLKPFFNAVGRETIYW